MPYYDVDEEVIAALASSLRVCSACACACVRAYAHGCIASHRIALPGTGLDRQIGLEPPDGEADLPIPRVFFRVAAVNAAVRRKTAR